MIDPSLALQAAIVVALKADEAVKAIIAERVFDQIGPKATYPLVQIGEFQTITADAECIDSVEVFVTLHVWSREAGQTEAKRLAGMVRTALHQASLDLGYGFSLVEIRHQDSRILNDPDGITTHGVMTFRALIDPA